MLSLIKEFLISGQSHDYQKPSAGIVGSNNDVPIWKIFFVRVAQLDRATAF